MKKAFTLIELLLYLGLITVVISAIVPFAWTVIQIGQKAAVQQEVFNNARFVSEKLKRQIRDASSVDLSSTFDTNLAGTGYKVTLIMPNPTPEVVIDVVAGKVRLSNVELNSNGSEVTELIFTNYSSGRSKHVGFTMTMTGAITTGSNIYQADTQLKSSAEMRN